MIRMLISLLMFAILIWFATMVPLGNRTLWGHIKAISGTQEAKDFADGTRKEAKKVADQVLAPPDMAASRGTTHYHAK